MPRVSKKNPSGASPGHSRRVFSGAPGRSIALFSHSGVAFGTLGDTLGDPLRRPRSLFGHLGSLLGPKARFLAIVGRFGGFGSHFGGAHEGSASMDCGFRGVHEGSASKG